MSQKKLFKEAHPYQKDVLALPVTDIDAASKWYSEVFGMKEVDRFDDPYPTVILERDGVQIGFAINGGDASQDGAAIMVTDIHRAKEEIQAKNIQPSDLSEDERHGCKFQVFFVVAPDELCYYFHQIISE